MSAAPFLLASLAVLLAPGPTNTMLAASGAAMGVRRAIVLPVAEAIGYAAAISLFLLAGGLLRDVPAAMPVLKGIAAAWLLAAAIRLWSRPAVPGLALRHGAFPTVMTTTMLNPKAMLVGTILIPGMMPESSTSAVLLFVALSMIAGLGWTLLGASLPAAGRPYAYKAAALVITGFALTAAASAVAG